MHAIASFNHIEFGTFAGNLTWKRHGDRDESYFIRGSKNGRKKR